MGDLRLAIVIRREWNMPEAIKALPAKERAAMVKFFLAIVEGTLDGPVYRLARVGVDFLEESYEETTTSARRKGFMAKAESVAKAAILTRNIILTSALSEEFAESIKAGPHG